MDMLNSWTRRALALLLGFTALWGATGCGTARVYLAELDDEAGTALLGARPGWVIRNEDVSVRVHGQALTVEDIGAVELSVARRLRKNLAAQSEGQNALRTEVTITVPEFEDLSDIGMTPAQKSLKIEIRSILPSGEEVVTKPTPVFIDDGGGLAGRQYESMIAPAMLGAFAVVLSVGAVGLLATTVYHFFLLPSNPQAAPWGGIAVGAASAGAMAVAAVPSFAAFFLFALNVRGAQNERVEDALSDAVRAHAYDLMSAAQAVKRAARRLPLPKTSERTDPSERGPESLPDDGGTSPKGQQGAGEGVAASEWVVEVQDDAQCLDTATLQKELQAWVALEPGTRRVVRAGSERIGDARVKAWVEVVDAQTDEVLADKKIEVAAEDCGEVARLMAQSLRRQLR